MPERKEHLDTLAVTLLVASCLFWGFQQILVKMTLPEVPPLWQAALRFAGATVLLWLWWRGRNERAREAPFADALLAMPQDDGEFARQAVRMRDLDL